MPLLLLLALAACQSGSPPATTEAPAATPTVRSVLPPTWTPSPSPTPTPAPLAASVNGEGITLAAFEAELARYLAAAGTDLATEEDEQRVLAALVDQRLLAQAAFEAGYTAGEAEMQARYDDLAQRLGGTQALERWMAANGYDEQSLRADLALSAAAAWMRDQIAAQALEDVLQTHARQILLYDAEAAEQALSRLQAGEAFDDLAREYDPLNGGDLGWFPTGFLLDPSLDEVAFRLEPGAYSEIVQTAAGYHILQVLERASDQPLLPEARLVVQSEAVRRWLAERRSQSELQVLLP